MRVVRTDRCEIARFDPEAWDLFFDFEVLRQLEADQGNDLDRSLGGHLLNQLNNFCNIGRLAEVRFQRARFGFLDGLSRAFSWRTDGLSHEMGSEPVASQ